jgi:hypothetical protein
MTELINELARTKSGLYNLKIRSIDGRQLVDVTSITRAQAMLLIDEQEAKADRRSKNDD